jgi:cellulose synthase/poly-beta-1,6-N-acetylglucosamine synthase-like glycosyltransferase
MIITNILLVLFYLLEAFIAIHLIFPIYLWIVQVFKTKRTSNIVTENAMPDYAFIVTAYQQVTLIPEVVNSILGVNYQNYLIYVVADNCDVSNLKFDDERVIILRPAETLAGNVKSHFYAINNFKRKHQRLTIIDSDNIVDENYLLELNKVFDLGYQAVQGVRAAKNLNTTYACLDAANDIYYRYVDKFLLTKAGSSSSLSGSGMAFTTQLYIDCLKDIDSSGAGFDKILQFEIIQRKYKIAFAANAIVYDEKTSKSDQLVKQRARWINTWFKFFKLGLNMLLKGMFNFNKNQFLFGIMLCRPPLFILMFFSMFCFVVNIFVMPYIAIFFAILALCFVFIFLKALSYFKADKKIYKSLLGIPMFVFYQLKALTKARIANKLSVATEHFVEKTK